MPRVSIYEGRLASVQSRAPPPPPHKCFGKSAQSRDRSADDPQRQIGTPNPKDADARSVRRGPATGAAPSEGTGRAPMWSAVSRCRAVAAPGSNVSQFQTTPPQKGNCHASAARTSRNCQQRRGHGELNRSTGLPCELAPNRSSPHRSPEPLRPWDADTSKAARDGEPNGAERSSGTSPPVVGTCHGSQPP